jgi:hypothetical protein
MATSTPPGNGKSSPFVTSPGSGGGAGKFDLQAGRGAPAAGKAPPFDQFAQRVPTDGGGSGHDIQQAQTPAGGVDLKADPPNAASSADVGTRTQGQNKSGFKLNGG